MVVQEVNVQCNVIRTAIGTSNQWLLPVLQSEPIRIFFKAKQPLSENHSPVKDTGPIHRTD
uniref:Uncharacterized protein n=1 Tax=Anguilla anguilla TaxID=7936 RepID=A0A0E9R258_ANGAN